MLPFRILRSLFDALTWSEKPRWVSPPLQGTKFSRGRYLRRVWLHDELSRPPADRVYLGLGGIDISHIRDRRDLSRVLVDGSPREVKAEICGMFLEACLELPAYDDLVRSDCKGRLFRLDLAITEMTPGIAALRFYQWLTLLGLGHAYLQIEGILSQPDRGQALIKFVSQRRHSGLSAPEDWWPLAYDRALPDGFARSMIGQLIGRTAYDIVMELGSRLGKTAD